MDENKKFCPYCDFVIDKNCEVCPHCGNKGKKGKSKYTVPVAVLSVVVAIVLFFPFYDAFEQYRAKKEYEQTLQNIADYSQKMTEAFENAEVIEPEELTRYMLNNYYRISRDGEDDAEHSENPEATVNEALEYIKVHIDNPYESYDVMEQFIYYGGFLYKYSRLNNDGSKRMSDLSFIGVFAGAAVKDVYTDDADPESEDVKKYFNSLIDCLEDLEEQ